MASSAVLNPVKEGRFLLPGNDRRPADVLLPNWAAGRDAALDVTVVNPLQQATVHNAGFYIGHQLSSQPCESHKSAYDILRENNIKEKEEMIRSLGLENVNWKESKKVGQSKKGKKKK